MNQVLTFAVLATILINPTLTPVCSTPKKSNIQLYFLHRTDNMRGGRVLTLTLLSVTMIVSKVRTSDVNRCTSLNNVEVTVQSDEGKKYKTRVNGCIERTAFKDRIIAVQIKDQDIPHLGLDSVRHVVNLQSIIFDSCNMKSIEAGAFRNVLSLKLIKMVFGSLAEIPELAFSSVEPLEILKLSHNKIATIQNKGFGDLPNLRWIYCDHNRLENFDKRWFTDSTGKIEFLNFQWNRIKSIPSKAFVDFVKIRKIFFDYNELETIHPEAFKGIRKLEQLGLAYNRLKKIDAAVFPKPFTVDSLTLGANYLNFLSNELTGSLTVGELYFDGNPWKCPCWENILRWMQRINATVKNSDNCKGNEVPVCSFADHEPPRTCVESVSVQVTATYLQTLKSIDPPLHKYCAKLN